MCSVVYALDLYSCTYMYEVITVKKIHSKILGGNWPLSLSSYAYAHSSVQHYHRDSSPSRSYNFHGFVLHCQHDSFPESLCNFRDFVHNFSVGLSCSCHGFVLHCQHGSSLDLLDNPPSFCQLSSDCLLCSTTPRILHVFTLVLSSRVHSC